MSFQEKYQEVLAKRKEIEEKINSLKASLMEDDDEDKEEMMEEINSRISEMFHYTISLVDDVYRNVAMFEDEMFSYINKHRQGHLPPIEGAGKMQKALETLGISDDYEIEKKSIYANLRNKKGVVEVG